METAGVEKVIKGLPWHTDQYSGPQPVTDEMLQRINQSEIDKESTSNVGNTSAEVIKTSITTKNGYNYISTIYKCPEIEIAPNKISVGAVQSVKKKGKGKKVQEQTRQFITVFPPRNESNKPNIGTQDQSTKGKYQYHDS